MFSAWLLLLPVRPGRGVSHTERGRVLGKWSVLKGNLENALAKHLEIYHKDKLGDISTFTFKSEKIFKKPLDRQCFEGVTITNRNCDIKMNSKSEFHQPLCMRVTPTNQVSDNSRRPAGS